MSGSYCINTRFFRKLHIQRKINVLTNYLCITHFNHQQWNKLGTVRDARSMETVNQHKQW